MTIINSDLTDYIVKRRRYIELFFVIFYIVGFLGLVIPISHQLFLKLFPLALVLSFVVILFFNQDPFDQKTIIVLTLIGILSYLIEVTGVYTHIIFGNYKYGESLGIKLLNTPLLIGVNWVMLTYSGSSIAERISVPSSMKILIASALILIYDLILEQIAPVVDMWSWKNNIVPVRNYIAWFVIALVFQTFIRIAGIKTRNSIAWKIILIQAIFFLLLIMFFKILK